MSTATHPSTPAEASGPAASDQVDSYVQAVRAALSDLPSEEVEDLTAGMDADLAELLAERGGPLEVVLGSPQVYAAELRSAAGLPEAAGGGRRPISLRAWARAWSQRLRAQTEQRPWVASLVRGVVAIRPAWWVLRGLIAAWAVAGLLGLHGAALVPGDPRMMLLSIVGVGGSVALARGLWASALTRSLMRIGNVLAVLLLLPAMGSSQPSFVYVGTEANHSPTEGLTFNGRPVENVFVYDASGARLSDVRLFDDQGRSLVLSPEVGEWSTWAGRRDVTGQRWTNVFPVAWPPGADPWTRDPGTQSDPTWHPPMTMPALGQSTANGTPTATVAVTPQTTATATSTAPSTATGTAAATATASSPPSATSTRAP